MTLIPALQKNEGLWNDIATHAGDAAQICIWWLGQSGFLISYDGFQLIIDPYLSDSLTVKYAQTDKPHVRMSERVIDPSLLRGINLVTSSHNHTDHLDAETLIPLIQNNPGIKMLIPEANRAFVTERIRQPFSFPIGISDGEEVNIDGIQMYGIPAAHNSLDRNADGKCLYMGYVFRIGGKHIYHSGDTLWFEGLEELLRPFHIDLALLPINGNDPARKVSGNLNAREAAQLAKAIGAKLTVPCHYDMFTFNTEDPNVFAREATNAAIQYKIMQHGEKLAISY
jgi:L-ascorbate metabolism protein UlaG (beta-lactamase superfamily)